MILEIEPEVLKSIRSHGEKAYPEEGAGLLLGIVLDDRTQVKVALELANARHGIARQNRYLLTADDYLHAEQEATRLGLDVVGVFHSHPDHPGRPSEFDREWAMPWFSYLITSIQDGLAVESRSWKLVDDRTRFLEEQISIVDQGESLEILS